MANKTFSILFWAKFNTAPSGANKYFFSQGTENNTGKNLTFNYKDGNDLRFSFWGSGNDIDTSGYDMTTLLGTTWHHYVVTFNNDTRVGEIWLDNQKLTTNISTFASSFTGSGSFYISKSSTYDHPFNGQIDDFRIYDKALTAQEISDIYNKTEPLVLLKPFGNNDMIGPYTITADSEEYQLYTFKYNSLKDNGEGQTEYSLTFDQDTTADILIIGGGGGGGTVEFTATCGTGGGGGGGGVVYVDKIKLNEVAHYKIKVGKWWY